MINRSLAIALRKQRSWSQDELAVAAGLNLRTVQRIERSGSASLQSKKARAAGFILEVAGVNLKARAEAGKEKETHREERLLGDGGEEAVGYVRRRRRLMAPNMTSATKPSVTPNGMLWNTTPKTMPKIIPMKMRITQTLGGRNFSCAHPRTAPIALGEAIAAILCRRLAGTVRR
jgi:transcriptional regulator with XRE-family HTH domain